MNGYYQVLGVSIDSTGLEIKKAYREKVKQFHPDLHPNNTHAQEKIQQINDAYAVLGDPDKRKKYDSEQGIKIIPSPESKTASRSAAPDFRQMHDNVSDLFKNFMGF